MPRTRAPKASLPPCVLCGGPPRRVVLFEPLHPRRWGLPPGAAIPHTLCAACDELPPQELNRLVDGVLWARHLRRHRASWN